MERQDTRLIAGVSALVLVGLAITALAFTLPADSVLGDILLGRRGGVGEGGGSGGWPLTIQSAQWMVFAIGLSELVVRQIAVRRDHRALRAGLLPQDDETVLRTADLVGVYERLPRGADGEAALPRLIRRVIRQLQIGQSPDRAHGVLTATLDIELGEMGLRYAVLRTIVWLIPTLGFIGTVQGIAEGLAALGDPGAVALLTGGPVSGGADAASDSASQNAVGALLQSITGALGSAFYTTLLGLVLAAVIVLGTAVIETAEERAVNLSGAYCIDNLINRLWHG